ncbi:MAG: hypothetical protein AAF668_06605 [Pseudomonadota bacterium]
MWFLVIAGAIFGAVLDLNSYDADAGLVIGSAIWGALLGLAVQKFIVNFMVVVKVAWVFVIAVAYLLASAFFVALRWERMFG